MRLVKLLKTHTDEGQGYVEDRAMGQSFSGATKGSQGGHSNSMGLRGKRTRNGKRAQGQGQGLGQGESSMPTTERSGLDNSMHSDNGGSGSDTDNERGGSFISIEGTRRSFGDGGGGNGAVAGGGGGRRAESEGGPTVDTKASIDGRGNAVGVDISPARTRGITIESIKNRFKQALPHGYRDVSHFTSSTLPASFSPHRNITLTLTP